MKIFASLVTLAFLLPSCGEKAPTHRVDFSSDLTESLSKYIHSISFDTLHDLQPDIEATHVSQGIYRVVFNYSPEHVVHQDDWQVRIKPAFKPDLYWAPHLTPTSENIIAQHVFRSPALIVADSSRQLAVVPDLDLLRQNSETPWYMDLDAEQNILTLGISKSKVTEHVIFARDTGLVVQAKPLQFGFYILIDEDPTAASDPWRKPLAFLWDRWGKSLYEKGEPVATDLALYVKHAYSWAFDTWGKNVWQEFSLQGKKVGAPVFIVNVTQSPNYPGPVNEREFRSIWNQAWFSSLRSASGLYRYARRNNDKALLNKARMTKELALSFPQRDGLFPAVIATEMERIEQDGKKLARSKGWSSHYFGNSNRNPVRTWGGAAVAPYHLLDMSWTAYLMLTWYEELEQDQRLKQYAFRYADKLITLQNQNGFFPAWLDLNNLQPLPHLETSPETSMSVTFLLKAYEMTKEEKYLASAEKAMQAVITQVIPNGQWEDFETYWSCSGVLDSLAGQQVARNRSFKQNTFGMYWTAEALYNFYKLTTDKKYLLIGQRVLDELLMYQASWQPPYIAIHALGGFGVMNADGEWNDSRQSLFAELIYRYGEALQLLEYKQRGIAALKASFVMMYCPENPETKAQFEKVYPFFNEKDYGFMMENYGHGGKTDSEGLGIGEFTIYDWGNGAAAEAYERMKDHGAL